MCFLLIVLSIIRNFKIQSISVSFIVCRVHILFKHIFYNNKILKKTKYFLGTSAGSICHKTFDVVLCLCLCVCVEAKYFLRTSVGPICQTIFAKVLCLCVFVCMCVCVCRTQDARSFLVPCF